MITTILNTLKAKSPAEKRAMLVARLQDLRDNREWLVMHSLNLLEVRMARKELGLQHGPRSKDEKPLDRLFRRIECSGLPVDKPNWLPSTQEVNIRIEQVKRRLEVIS